MKRHLKRLSAPKFWRVPRKTNKWVVKPRPGPHKNFESIPLLILIRDVLKLADDAQEAKKIIKSKEVLVDKRPRKDHKHPVGLMDVVEIPRIKKVYRIVSSERGLVPITIPKKEFKLKLCRIDGKNIVKGKKLQLNLHDGRNLLIEKKDVFKTGDSVLIELPNQKIVEHMKMESGKIGLITGGQNQGEIVKIKDVITTRSREPNKVVCESKGREFEIIKDYVFVVGSKKPIISVG